MGGSPTQNKNELQNVFQNTSQNFSGTTNQAQTQQQLQQQAQQQAQLQQQQQQLNPFAPASGLLSSILGNTGSINPNLSQTEQEALSRLGLLGQQGNPFQGGVNNVASTLLGGGANNTGTINSAYSALGNQLNPVANASLNPYETPGFADAWKTLQGDITNNINGQFAAAGRDLSGMNTQTLARGLQQGGGQLLANQYNQNVQNRINAANQLYSGGAGTTGILSQLEQARLGNMQAGIPAAQAAFEGQASGPMLQLQVEAQRRGIPLQTLISQMGLTLPAAQAFGQQTGTGTSTGTSYGTGSSTGSASGTSNTSGSSQGTMTGLTSGNSQTSTSTPLWQQLLGGGIGAAGLLGGMGAFGNNGWLNFGTK